MAFSLFTWTLKHQFQHQPIHTFDATKYFTMEINAASCFKFKHQIWKRCRTFEKNLFQYFSFNINHHHLPVILQNMLPWNLKQHYSSSDNIKCDNWKPDILCNNRQKNFHSSLYVAQSIRLPVDHQCYLLSLHVCDYFSNT